MTEQDIVKNMIEFIENKERELQANKMNSESHVKSDIVKQIMDELERETNNENN